MFFKKKTNPQMSNILTEKPCFDFYRWGNAANYFFQYLIKTDAL